MKPKKPLLRRSAGAVISIALLVIPILAIRMADHRKKSAAPQPVKPMVVITKQAEPVPVSALSDKVILRPLPVSRKSVTHEWAEGDGAAPAIIEKIARNPDEFIRMVEENDRIRRRQLVYRNETVPMLLQRANISGRPLESFTLPALDGKEVEVVVREIHEEPSLHGGSVIGRVKGRFDSMVSVGFVNGCESFNVISPEDGLYLTADAREPGEVIVKEIDPDKYAPVSGNESDFILTHESPPKTHDH